MRRLRAASRAPVDRVDGVRRSRAMPYDPPIDPPLAPCRPGAPAHVLRPRQPAADPADRGRRHRHRGDRAPGRRRRPVRGPPGAGREADRRRRSSSCPTSAGSTPTTRSWRCGSPRSGVDALAIDYFGRTAGIGIRERPTDFDFMSHVGETRFSNLSWDVQAAAEKLRGLGPGRGRAVFSIGFCFGGRLAFLAEHAGTGPGGRDRLLRLAGGRRAATSRPRPTRPAS